MGKFNSRALTVLDRVYNFVGGKTLGRDFDTETPIQPVHDVSREAEIGAGLYWNWSWLIAVAGTTRFASTIYDQFTWYSNLSDAEVETWIVDVIVNINQNPANFTSGVLALYYPPFGEFPGSQGSNLEPAKMVYRNGTPTVHTITNRAATGVNYFIPNELDVTERLELPYLIHRGSGLAGTFILGGAGGDSCTVNVVMWTGPRGSRPPGVA